MLWCPNNMSEIKTTGDYYTTTVDSSNLEEIQKSLLSDTEIIAYSVNSDGNIDVLIDLEGFEQEYLRYIH